MPRPLSLGGAYCGSGEADKSLSASHCEVGCSYYCLHMVGGLGLVVASLGQQVQQCSSFNVSRDQSRGVLADHDFLSR